MGPRPGRVALPSGSMTELPIGGTCDPAFGAVRDAFVENFAERGEVGAAVHVIVDGRPVVDLLGGWRDEAQTQPWRPTRS